MAITAKDVQKLREMTGVGMMDCKKALTEAEGDFDKAIEWLREKGLAAQTKKAGKVAAEGVNPFEQWSEVVKLLQEKDPMLHSYLRKSKAYFDGTRVLIDGGKTFRDFIRVNKDSQRLIKKLIKDVSGTAVPIGPYEPKSAGKTVSNAEQSLRALEKLGLDVSIEDSARKTRS